MELFATGIEFPEHLEKAKVPKPPELSCTSENEIVEYGGQTCNRSRRPEQ